MAQDASEHIGVSFLAAARFGATLVGQMAGMKETLKAAEQGMALFAKEEELAFDIDGATAFKEQHESLIKEKEELAASLTGKDNKKARTEVSKEVSSLKVDEKYVDACKVLKGLA